MPYRSVSLKRAKHLKGNLYLADYTFRLISLSMFKAYLGFLKLKRKECLAFTQFHGSEINDYRNTFNYVVKVNHLH